MAETAKHGTLSIKRAYGDFTSPRLAGWRALLPALAIQPVQQFPYSTRKKATDSALIIDAMDLLHSTGTEVFCIVSSDSDFTRLAMRLREAGRRVYGIGARRTPQAFRHACDRFTYLEILADASPSETPNTTQSGPVAVDQASEPEPMAEPEAVAPPLEPLLRAAVAARAKDDGWAPLSSVGWYVVNTHPTFDSRGYGYLKLGDLVRDQAYLEVDTRLDGSGTGHLWVRLR